MSLLMMWPAPSKLPFKDSENFPGLHCYSELQEFIMMERRKTDLKTEINSLPKDREESTTLSK